MFLLGEHASVASFARFTLDLLSLGAPPGLLSAAFHAGQEEISHTQLCLDRAMHHSNEQYQGIEMKPLPTHHLEVSGNLTEVS